MKDIVIKSYTSGMDRHNLFMKWKIISLFIDSSLFCYFAVELILPYL